MNPPLLGIASLYPFNLAHPMKILANVGGIALIYGVVKVMLDRRHTGHGPVTGSAFDWIFAWLLLGIGVTGYITEVLRFAAGPAPDATFSTVAYSIYFVHLVLVFHLLVYLPYSKFAHVLYRTVAMVYAEHTGRYPPPPRVQALPGATGLNGAGRLTPGVSPGTHPGTTAATR